MRIRMWKLKTFSHQFEMIAISAEGWVLRLRKNCGKKPIEYLRWYMMGLIYHSTRISVEIFPINKINTYFFGLKPVGGKMKIAPIAISAQHAFIRILKVCLYTLIYHFELNFSMAPVRNTSYSIIVQRKMPIT